MKCEACLIKAARIRFLESCLEVKQEQVGRLQDEVANIAVANDYLAKHPQPEPVGVIEFP